MAAYTTQKTGAQIDASLTKADNADSALNTTNRTETLLSNYTDINGWKINEDGNFNLDEQRKIRRYPVTAGNTYYVSDAYGRLVFESTAGTVIEDSVVNNLIGDIVVPTGATLLTIDLPLNGTAFVELIQQVTGVKDEADRMYKFFSKGDKPHGEVVTGNLVFGDGGRRFSRTGVNPIDPIDFELDGSYNGIGNTVFGIEAGKACNTGNMNTFIGYRAGVDDENGDQNTFVGWAAGEANVDGYHNTLIGVGASQNVKHGYHNVIIGTDSNLSGTTGGNNNTLIGTGVANKNNGSGNVALGSSTMSENDTSSYNTAIGTFAMGSSVSQQNVAVGYLALGGQNEMSAERNVGIGVNSGYAHRSGSENVFIGYNAGGDSDVQATDASNSVAIGYGTNTTKSNQVVIGNDDVTEIILAGKKLIFNQDGTVSWTAAT